MLTVEWPSGFEDELELHWVDGWVLREEKALSLDSSAGQSLINLEPTREEDAAIRELLATPPVRVLVGRPKVEVRSTSASEGLFFTIAALTPDEDAILAFAQDHGRLGPGAEATVAILPADEALWGYVVVGGEQYALSKGDLGVRWAQEITAMRTAVGLWEAVKASDVFTLRRVFRWYPSGDVIGESRWLPGLAADGFAKIGWVGRDVRAFPGVWDPGSQWDGDVADSWDEAHVLRLNGIQPHSAARDVVAVAQAFLADLIDRRLSQLVLTRFVINEGQPATVKHSEGLLGELWLQLAEAVERNLDYRACGECGRLFEVRPDIARSDKKYCSVACRMRAYRKARRRGTQPTPEME